MVPVPNASRVTLTSDLPSVTQSVAVARAACRGRRPAPAMVAAASTLRSESLILTAWIFAGLVSFFGALACAELGAAIPASGGQYVFLRESYGPFAGFLCGWTMFVVARTAQVAWLAVTISLYTGYLIPLGPIAGKLLALASL